MAGPLRWWFADGGGSRRTFYELFDDREDCFVAAYDEAMGRALRVVTNAYLDEEGSPEDRLEAALRTLLELCVGDPACARMCVVEVFAAGARTRERRAEAMDRLARLTEHALGELRGDDRLDRVWRTAPASPLTARSRAWRAGF